MKRGREEEGERERKVRGEHFVAVSQRGEGTSRSPPSSLQKLTELDVDDEETFLVGGVLGACSVNEGFVFRF